MSQLRYPNRWKVGDWTFYEVHGLYGHDGRALFGYSIGDAMDDQGMPKIGELYNTLEHAMAAAIAEKYTGPRGAGGTGVGTAADWFMRMIGAGQIQEAGAEGGRALMDALRDNADKPLAASRVERALEAKGYIIARQAL